MVSVTVAGTSPCEALAGQSDLINVKQCEVCGGAAETSP